MQGRTNAGGTGGFGLNLKIVNGTTMPSNPRENTVWVDTDTAITGYVLSSSQPETTTNGTVWLRTQESGVEVDVGRKNSILLHFNGAALCLSGAWTYMDGYIYTSNTWTQFSSKRLPAIYQEVEFLQSVGSYTANNTGQYIDTGILLQNTHYGFDVKYNMQSNTSTGTAYGAILGARKSGANEDFSLLTYNGGEIRYGTNGYVKSIGIKRNVDQTISLHVGKYTLPSGDTGNISLSSFENKYPLAIFAVNSAGTVVAYGRFMLYYLKLYDDSDNLIADYIPCYRKSDKVAGLWDTVSKKFLTNSGTGTFSVGGDVA